MSTADSGGVPKSDKSHGLRSEDILPPPFAWVEIPAGKVKLIPFYDDYHSKDDYFEYPMVVDVPAFAINKYPITNAQFAKFIEVGGYREQKWWTAAGWEFREQGWAWNSDKREWGPTGNPWIAPRFWQDNIQWSGAEQPIMGVSWYESAAFCCWLSEVSGEKIMLPTDPQWQRAAQGDDGRDYPWGNDWDGTRCNNSVYPQKSKRTTPVRHYEGRGDSPYGVVDLAGNLMEWCLTSHKTGRNEVEGTDDRVLHGAAWLNGYTVNFYTWMRQWSYPIIKSLHVGFRCARSLD
jgi:formylglycine-generating enzyme required for sulfatase activity